VRSLRLRGVPPPRKWRTGPGNARGAGARSSCEWQKSVGRIARLLHRRVARPVGVQRALAWRKFVAPPDAGHEWVEGETVRVCAVSKKSLRARGLRVSACRFSIRRKAFSERCPSCFHRQGGKIPLARGSTPHHLSARRVCWRADRADQDSDSAVPMGDSENVRGQHGSVKALQGPRRSAGSPHPRRSKRRRSQRCTAS